jgi:hypothetical protein
LRKLTYSLDGRTYHSPNKALQLTRRLSGQLSVLPRYRLYFVLTALRWRRATELWC